MARKKQAKIGRPPKRKGERLSKNRTFRVRGTLDEQLEAAAQKAERSVSEEIERRLEDSFRQQEIEKLTGAVKLQVTLSESLWQRLERAAKHKGHSTDIEIFDRLDVSFQREDRKRMEERAEKDAVQALQEPLSAEEWEKKFGGGPSADS